MHVSKASLYLLVCVLAIFMVNSSVYADENALTEVKRFAGGTAYRTGDDIYWVLSLNGTWQEMGRQYGGLVKDELREFYTEITEDIAQRGITYNEQLENGRLLAATSSYELNELLKGISETSGLSEDEVFVLNSGMSNLANAIFGIHNLSACSGIAAWGEYTPDGTLTFGRNWDIERAGMLKYMKYLSVVVFNPDSGNGFANIHPLGNVYLETGMNDKGVFIELNNGAWSDPQYVEGREDTVSVLVTALNRYNTLAETVQFLIDTPADLSHIIQVADAKESVSVERPTFSARVRKNEQPGLLAAYNSFIPPYPQEWNEKIMPPPDLEDDPRYDNLIKLANSDAFFGRLDVNGMKAFMDVGVRNGGAVHGGTVLQVIAQPQTLTVWIRGLEYSDWQTVDLKGLFAN